MILNQNNFVEGKSDTTKHKDYGKVPDYIKKYELEREIKNKGFNIGIEALKNKINEKDSNINNNNNSSIVNNVINKIFENEECIIYDNLLMNICQQMNISNTDDEKINQIKKEIDENCILIKMLELKEKEGQRSINL